MSGGAWYRLASGQLFHVSGHRHVVPSRSVRVDEADALAEVAGAPAAVAALLAGVLPEHGVEVVEGATAPTADVPVADEASQLDEVVTVEGDTPTVDEGG